MNRRRFLIGTGGAAACVLLGGGAFVTSRDIAAARAPWESAAGDFDDPRMQALAFAILAPNPHNQQPWLIELVGNKTILLHPDTSRFLPETDPPNRQITIGYGAFLELLSQAASANGMVARIDTFPDGAGESRLDARPIASIQLEPSDQRVDPHFSAISKRRTTRQPFDVERPVTDDDLSTLAAVIGDSSILGMTSDPERVAKITAINQAAWTTEMETAHTHAESTRLTRIGAAEVIAQPDGISLAGPLIESISLAGLFSRENMSEKGSFAFDETHAFYARLIAATPTYGGLISKGNSREEQLDIGRQWARLNQQASAMGIGFHPISQALQEYPEMKVPFAQIHTELGVELPGRVQGVFRLGYTKPTPPAPRWPLMKKLKTNV